MNIDFNISRTQLKAVFLSVYLLLLLIPSQTTVPTKQSVAEDQIPTDAQIQRPGLPKRLRIPAINVDADIQYVGVTSNGEMDVPSNATDVAWYKPGTRPGEKGSAVIAGHFNGRGGEAGVFSELHKLEAGDELFIVDDNDATHSFKVRESREYDPGHADEVFTENDKSYLNLITCFGEWDEVTETFKKRLVVFADIIN